MNFFAAQEQARKASRKLVLWFSLCVLAVILLLYIALVGGMIASASGSSVDRSLNPPPSWWQPGLFMVTFVVVGGIIVIGSLCKLARLSGGGAVIARDLGGRQVDPSTREPLERRLLNVVEEMAIASGMPVPEVWIMDAEEGINAFAAGTDPGNAVIGVTRGTLEQLTRSELQGVIAHEYSHILNGDMKLNMRLTGWIFGLVMVAVLGRLLLQSLRYLRGSRDSKGSGVVLGILAIGLTVWIIGSIGVLFARILQAAISRQREFLADASAVQFTRYPDGIAGALKKIGGYGEHSHIKSAKATETRHMFFASSSLMSLLATHPPLEERIRAIDPKWKGEMLDGGTDPVRDEEFKGAMGFAGTAVTPPPPPVGTVAIGQAQAPMPLPMATEEPAIAPLAEAKAGLLGLLLDPADKPLGRSIMERNSTDPMVVQRALDVCDLAHGASSQEKLTLIDASLPWLRRMHDDEARALLVCIGELIQADGQIDLFEFMLQQVCQRHIEIGLGLRRPPAIRYKRIVELEDDIAQLLAIFAAVADGEGALDPARQEYLEHTGHELPVPDMDFSVAAEALQRMDSATPLVKRQILRLCWLTVHEDGEVNDAEAELLRAVAEALGCALPRQGNAFADLS